MKLSVFLVLLVTFELSAAKRILFVLPGPSRSHFFLHEQLVEKLTARGHEIVVVAPYKLSRPCPNTTEITVPDKSKEMFKKFAADESKDGKFQMRNMNPFMFLTMGNVGQFLMEAVMNHPPMKELLKSNKKFDLVVGETFMMEGLLAGLAHKLKAPMAMTCPTHPFTYVNEMTGNPFPAAYIPDAVLGYTDSMTFKERLVNFIYTLLGTFAFYYIHIPKHQSLVTEYFGPKTPPILDILRNNSVVLINNHFSLAFPRPYNPNMIEVGGYHVRPPKPLPKDLQKFMDDAKDGVIFFSMGSNLRSDEFPKEKFDGILRAFSRLKQKVLWKFETENPENLPKNVKISKWFPQPDILAHPNIKLFITHGGLLSTTESIFRGVPLIGIPIFGDQPANVRYIEKIGVGIKLDYDDIGEENMYKSIQEVLNNPKYSENAKFRSKVLQDRPLPPVDMAVYWLEYVMRYNGAPHLRSGALDLSWAQLYMLDVLAVIFFILFVIVECLNRLLQRLFRRKKETKKATRTSSKKKKN